MNRLIRASGVLLASLFGQAWAMNTVELTDAVHHHEGRWVQALPYAFASESLGTAVGIGVGGGGFVQPNMYMVGTLMGTSNESWLSYFYLGDYQVPKLDRLFVDLDIYDSQYTRDRIYLDGNPDFPDERAGSNQSSNLNRVITRSLNQSYQIKFRYLLPLGQGADAPIHDFKLRNGKVLPGYEAGGKEWNPFTSGRTILHLTPFYERNDVGDLSRDDSDETNGLRVALEYDNRDYYGNPTAGSRQQFTLTRDWGTTDSPGYLHWEFAASKYFDLGGNDWANQQVLALSFWTADTPSWNSAEVLNGKSVKRRPPWFASSTLGGYERMFGFEENRFHDRSAIHYAAEYRFTPHWNPLPQVPLLNYFNFPAWHLVATAEVGRVAPNWSLNTLHQDMHWSVGASLRVSVETAMVRADIATSDQDTLFRLGINHPF